MPDTGPNFPPVVYRSSDDIAETLTPAEAVAVVVVGSLPARLLDHLGSILVSELGVYDLEAVRELGKHII